LTERYLDEALADNRHRKVHDKSSAWRLSRMAAQIVKLVLCTNQAKKNAMIFI